MMTKMTKEPKVEYDTIATESGEYKTTLNRMYRERKPTKSRNPKHILSFMPGTVEEFKVKVGDKVRQGDCLMIFRAMKMQNRLLAPMDGRIKSINIAINENAPKGTLLLELE